MKCLSSILLMLMVTLCLATVAQAKFTIVALPDTQKYSENCTPADWSMVTPEYAGGLAPIFAAQTQWIVDQRQARNIQFVVHLGDLVEHGSVDVEWGVADRAMRILDQANMPYGVCLGNHDNHTGYRIDPNVPDLDPNAVQYVTHFGCTRFAGKIWYRGTSPTMKSNYEVIQVEGRQLLFLNLSIDTPQSELDWAQQVLDENPDKLVVLSTHRYLYDFRILQGRYGDGVIGHNTWKETGLADEWYDIGTLWPEALFQNFVKTHKNIFLVLCGHCHGQYRQVSKNNWGLPVTEVLTDYQDGPNGGNGWLRLMEFDFNAGTIQFSTYSPTLNRQRAITDDFMETLGIVNLYKDALMQGMGMSAAQEAQMMAQLQADIPGVTKDPALEAYMKQPQVQAYLTSQGLNYAWDGLWMQAFAAGQRNPSFSVACDFDAYLKN